MHYRSLTMVLQNTANIFNVALRHMDKSISASLFFTTDSFNGEKHSIKIRNVTIQYYYVYIFSTTTC